MDYRSHFIGAVDHAAFVAIRHKVDGGIEPIASMKAGLEIDTRVTLEGKQYSEDLNMSPKLA